MGTKYPQSGEWVKIPLLPNSVGKKSVNDAGPKQGHDTNLKVQSSTTPGVVCFDQCLGVAHSKR